MAIARSLLLVSLALAACGGRGDIDFVPDTGTSGAESTAGQAGQAPSEPDPAPAPATTSCDPKQLLCRRAAPVCPEGQVPSISDRCYGPCVRVEQCACKQADDCPNPDSYTCHLYAQHCGYFVE